MKNPELKNMIHQLYKDAPDIHDYYEHIEQAEDEIDLDIKIFESAADLIKKIIA